jgi:hypothetical protein
MKPALGRSRPRCSIPWAPATRQQGLVVRFVAQGEVDVFDGHLRV